MHHKTEKINSEQKIESKKLIKKFPYLVNVGNLIEWLNIKSTFVGLLFNANDIAIKNLEKGGMHSR